MQEIDQKVFDDIKQIGQEMIKQSNRMTQNVMFVVMEDVERVVPDGCGDQVRKPSECWNYSDLCDSCRELQEDGDILPDECDDCDQNCFGCVAVNKEPNLNAGVFFTAEACQAHIDENSYHYTNPISYGISCWRNPEMQAVQKHLIELSGEKVPTHYR